jgi:hypothetical protein
MDERSHEKEAEDQKEADQDKASHFAGLLLFQRMVCRDGARLLERPF